MSLALHVIHQVPGRIRLRAADGEQAAEALAALMATLSGLEGVSACQMRPLTGSLIVQHEGDFAAIAEQAEAEGLFSLAETPAPKPIGLIAEEGLTYADLRLRELSDGQWDLRSSLGTLLLLLAVLQLARGQIVGPSLTLLLQSLDLLSGGRR